MKLSRSPEAIEVYRRELKKLTPLRYRDDVAHRVDRMSDEEVAREMEQIMGNLVAATRRLVQDLSQAVAAMAPSMARVAAAIEASSKKTEE